MGLFQGHRRSRIAGASQVQAVVHDGADDMIMRRETTAVFTTRRTPADPYSAWLEQRKAERQRDEQTPVRWVYAYHGEAEARSGSAMASDGMAARHASPRSREPIYG